MKNPFKYFKTSPEVIRLAVMMYIRYPLSLRQVEDILFERGIDICHETVRLWWNRFGPMFAAERSVAQQSSRKLTPTVPPTRRSDGQVQRHQDPAEVCCPPRLHPQSFQPGTSSLQSRELQTQSLRRLGRVASTCSLSVLDCWLYWADQVSLTMPNFPVFPYYSRELPADTGSHQTASSSNSAETRRRPESRPE